MRILTKEKWSLFKQDGKLFESLVEELLKAEYPKSNFKHTGWTRDGGKDFESELSFLDKKRKTWAECKYHKKSLPIHDVSMTLFMAYVESAQTILFFSYSPVNSEFQKYIDLYQKKSNKNVKIFDDIALEELILKNKDKISFSKYFGDFRPDQTIEIDSVTYKYWVHSKNQSKSLHINELVRLEFCATNHSSKEIKFKVKIKHNKNSKKFEIINSSIGLLDEFVEVKIPPNGIAGCSFDLKLSEYSTKLRYPSIVTERDGFQQTLRINNSVECLWLAEVPLLGEQNKRLIERMPTFLNTESANIGMLIGGSGTGKSRIIDEMMAVTTALNYKKVSFDADVILHLSAESFFRKLISELEDIPELSHITAEKIKKKYLAEHENNEHTAFALQLLFDDKIEYMNINDKLVDYLAHVLSKRKYFITLDNIQFYDETILKIFQSVITRHADLTSSFVLFSANTDYVYEDTLADRFIKQIKLMEKKFPHQFFYKVMENFSETDAYEYLQNCLNNNTNDPNKESFEYKLTLEKIIKCYGTNPLFLQNYLIYLQQEGIIKQTEYSYYYIKDIVRLKESFSKIPDKMNDLLKLREERFIDDIVSEELLEKYILFVSYLAFAKWMPYNMIMSLVDIPAFIIHSMKKVGLIKQNSKGEYGFYHQQIEEYYKQTYPYKEMSDASLQNFCDVALRQINRKSYVECIFLVQYILNDVDSDIYAEIIQKICLNDISFQKTQDVCTAISIILDNTSLDSLPNKYIDIYTHMINLLTDRIGISSAQELHQFVFNRFCFKPETFDACLLELTQILKSYIVNELHLNQPNNSLEICQTTISTMKKYYEDFESINFILSDIYEAQIFIYNELQELDKALEISNIVIELAEKTKSIQKLAEAWYVRGDIYYTNLLACNFVDNICECWNKALTLYEKNELKVDDSYASTAFYLNIYMRVVLMHIMQKDYASASIYMDFLKKYIGKTKMPFFEIKLRHLLVCFEIFFKGNNSKIYSEYEKLDSYIKESIDICAVYGSQTLYLDCFHLLAIIQRVCDKKTYAIDNYEKGYDILLLLLERQGNVFHWMHFILDIVIAMRQLKCKESIPPHIWHLISSDDNIHQEIYTICNIESQKLNAYLKNMQITSPLYYEEKFIHFPKI